ncbi:MAG: AMP-binding protein [Clostridia bacterium]
MKNQIKTLRDVVLINGEKYAKNVAIMEKRDSKKEFINYTYADLKEDTIDLATALITKYKLYNKKVAIIGENSYKWFVSYMAVTSATGIVVPLDKELPENEIVNLLVRSKAEAIIYSSRKEEYINNLKDKVPTVKHFIEMYSDEANMDIIDKTYESVIKEGRELRVSGDDSYEKADVKAEDFRVLLFTSGTTSDAKGVKISHKNILSNVESAPVLMPITPKDRFFSVLPIHHTYESTVTYMYAIYSGASVAVCQGLKYISKNIQEVSPSIIVSVPLLIDKIYKKILKTVDEKGKTKMVFKAIKITDSLQKVGIDCKKAIFKEIHDNLGGNLKYVLTGSAPMDPEVIKGFEAFGFKVLQGFGLTETAPLVCATTYKNRKPGTIGKAIECSKAKLFDVNEEGVGEIITKGPNVMLGYYENEEKTNEVIIDGWFHTGDLAYQDKKGNFYLCGRAKNVIVTKNGKKIFPEELEGLVNNIPEVEQSLVYEKENEEDPLDPAVGVIVTLDEEYIKEKYGKTRPSNEVLEEKIWKDIKDINRTLVPYKAMKNLKIKEGEFETTTTMKIKRFAEVKK